MPRVSVQTSRGPVLKEKYWTITENYGTRTRFDYGDEPWCLMGLDSISPADDTALVANADVFKLPDDLDQTMGSTANRNQARNALEAVNMPGTWIQTADTYRTVVRFVGALCQYMQCYAGHSGVATLFTGTTTLATTLGALPQNQQDTLVGCAQYFGLSTAPLTGANTLRTILKAVGDDYSAQYAAGQNSHTKLDLAGPL